MEASTGAEGSAAGEIRVLCLGNDLLADDALGILVADELRRGGPPGVEILDTIEAGLALLDYLVGARRVLVVDTILTGSAEPGSIFEVAEGDLPILPGNSPHYVGLFEARALGRMLGLEVPDELEIVAVEGADCTSVGGAMDPRVREAIPRVLASVHRWAEKARA